MKTTILCQKGNKALIRIDDITKLGNRMFKTVRHELWYDTDKMNAGIPGEEINGEVYIYCKGYAGSNEQELIEDFWEYE